jgi:hypothetical protein
MDLMRIGKHCAAAAVGVASLISAQCSKTSTSITTPTATKCEVGVTGAPAAPFPPNGGSGSISITATRDCTWSVSAESTWVTPGTTTGQGAATVSFTVAPNPVPSPRSGALLVSSQRVPLSQAAAPCHFDLSRTYDTIGSGGGRLLVDVATLTGCTWTAVSTTSWIAIQSGQSGNGNGTVGLTVSANSDVERSGQVTIAGQSYTVAQSALNAARPPPQNAPPGFSPAPIQFSGTVQNVSGRCPNIAIDVDGRNVVTNGDTDFSGLKCSDVKKRVRLRVDGTTQADGSVLATQVRKL